ncbi:MAG: RsmD family RNA methyltransferase [Actinomycetota bacterium]
MRVISGSARGRKIEAPPGHGTRPIPDRAKEAIFNMVVNLGGLDGARVLDLYAGSGSFGIESLSRGADHATFVEADRGAAAVLHANLDHLGFADRASVIVAPVATALRSLPLVDGDRFDVAFCDPPYAQDPWAELWASVPALLLVGHAENEIEVPEPWVELRRRHYGRAVIVIAERDG